ncbi:MAG: hypothetical protein ACLPXB_13755 [Thiobacillaceae bacterium]
MEYVIIIGLGQLGRVFAGGLLRTGHSIIPVRREDAITAVAQNCPAPGLVLVAVAEPDLHAVLTALPEPWRGRVGLIQNELLPCDWEAHQIKDPTVVSVWFEKKTGMDARPLMPSTVAGPKSAPLVAALRSIDLPACQVDTGEALVHELVKKNVYILTTNIAGLKTGGTVGELWAAHETFARRVAHDVIDIQDSLTGGHQDREALIANMVEAFRCDPQHQCAGRSASLRLKRALSLADQAGLPVPTLRGLGAASDE